MSRRIALIVGVSQYEPHTKLGNLSAPVNDAQRVYDVLSEYGGFDMLYPLPLADGKVGSSGKVLAQVLRDKLREVLNPQAGEEVELAVFYFSGHGVSHHGMASYLSATDDPLAVPLSFLTELVEDSTVKNLCIWLDCCHSGEVLKFKPSGKKSFCLVAASTADGEALAKNGQSLLTEILCEALTPDQDRPEIRVMEFVDYLEAHRKNLPQQVLFRGDSAFTLTRLDAEVAVKSLYPPDHRPYKGLLPFKTAEDSKFFFGRDGMIQQLLDKLSSSRFVPLLGASGSGKSSLVLAGLLPKLPESDWQVLVMRPTAQPLQNLRDTLVRSFPDTQVGTLESGADLQREVLRLVTAGKRLLLVIDQFEEVFTECRDDVARAAFFACLLEALDGDNPLHLVLTLRADFLGHCTEQAYSGLGQRLQHHSLLLVAPTAGELREAITRPLVLVGMRCEQALEDELVDQTLHAKGSLPLLQYVLEKLWQSARQERSRELTLAMYQQLGGQHGGGLRGVLNEKADAFYQQLEPQQQRLMEWLMVELVQVNEAQEDTRRTTTLQELHHRQPQYTAALDALLAQLVTHERLLMQDHNDHGQATITVAHEALIRDWQRLRGWLESNREIKNWRVQLTHDIADWQKDGGSLLRDGRLAEAQEMLTRYPDSLLIGEQETRFIQASKEYQQKELREKDRIFKEILVGKLTSQARSAMYSPSVGNGHIDQALLLAAQAFSVDKDSTTVHTTLRDLLKLSRNLHRVGHGHNINALAISADGKYLVSAGDNGKIQIWDTSSLKTSDIPCHGHNGSWVKSVALSTDSKLMASAGADGSVILWNMESRQVIHEIDNVPDIKSLIFSLDSKYLASVNDLGWIRIWDTKLGNIISPPWRGHAGGTVYALAFDLNSEVLMIADGDSFGCTISKYNPSTGQTISEPWEVCRDIITAATFASDCNHLVTATRDNIIRLWNILEKRAIGKPIYSPNDKVESLSVSPNGQYIVSISAYTLRLWDTLDHQDTATLGNVLQGHHGEIKAVVFSPDGYIFSGGRDASLRLWDIESELALMSFWRLFQSQYLTATALSPNNKQFVSVNGNDIELWSFSSEMRIGEPWQGHTDIITVLAFSPDATQVASASHDKTIRLWNVASGQQIGELWTGYGHYINTLAFSPSGEQIIGASHDGVIRQWDVTSGQLVNESKYEFCSNIVAISPDGQHIVSTDEDGDNVQLWRLADKKRIDKIGSSHSLAAFSPNGKNMVTVGFEEKPVLQWWDVTSGQVIGEPWLRPEGSVNSLAFSPDGKYITILVYQNTQLNSLLYIWDTDPASWAKKACSIVNRNFSRSEWQRFIGDALPYEKTCPDLPAPGEEGWVEPYVGE